jgi:glycosyltransferase involved in cell wall biosynthesis
MVTFNRLDYTKKAIPSVLNQTVKKFELHIVDNNSTDGTVEYLKSLNDPRVKLTLWNQNKGLSAATNFVFHHSDSQFFGKVDNDVIIPADWLERCLEAHKAYPDFGFIGGCHFTPAQLEPYKPIIDELNGIRVWRKTHIGGACFLIKAKDYFKYGPVNGQGIMGLSDYQIKFHENGKVNGFLYPFIWVDHMEYGESPNNIRTEEYENYSLSVRGMATDDYSNEQNTAPHHILYFKQNTL